MSDGDPGSALTTALWAILAAVGLCLILLYFMIELSLAPGYPVEWVNRRLWSRRGPEYRSARSL